MDRTFPVAGRDELRGLRHVFTTRSSRSLLNGHLWLSIATKPARSTFSRVQRLTCVLGVLFTATLVNIWNFSFKAIAADGADTDDAIFLKFRSFSVTSYSVTMGIISALITVPVNVLVVIFFSSRRLRPSKKPLNTIDKFKVPEKFRLFKTEDEMDDNEERQQKLEKSRFLRYFRYQ